MIHINDICYHRKYGVCEAVKKYKREINGIKENYLLLESVSEKELSVNIPEKSLHLLIRPLSEKKEIEAAFKKINKEDFDFHEKSNARNSQLKELLDQGDFEANLRVLKFLIQTNLDRTLSQYEQNYLGRAEKHIYSEIGQVYKCGEDEAKTLFMKKCGAL